MMANALAGRTHAGRQGCAPCMGGDGSAIPLQSGWRSLQTPIGPPWIQLTCCRGRQTGWGRRGGRSWARRRSRSATSRRQVAWCGKRRPWRRSPSTHSSSAASGWRRERGKWAMEESDWRGQAAATPCSAVPRILADSCCARNACAFSVGARPTGRPTLPLALTRQA